MKTLMMSLMAAAVVLFAASMAGANMMGESHHGLTAIDSAGLASITINVPSGPVGFVKVYDKITLDSNNLWVVNDVYSHPSEFETIAEKLDMEKGMAAKEGTLYCFDSISKFCAKAY